MKLYFQMRRYVERNRWFIELASGFFFINAANYLFCPQHIGFIGWALHPYWAVILFSSVRYGFFAGMISGLIALTNYLVYAFGDIPGRLEIEKFAEGGGLLMPVAFVSVGIILGAIRQNQIQKQQAGEEACQGQRREAERFKELYDASEKSKRLLESKIVNQSITMKTLYEEIRRLELVDRENVYKGCLDILAEYFQVHRSSIYVKENDYFVLKRAYGWDAAETAEGKVPCANNIMDLVFSEGKLLTAQDIIRRKDADQYAAQYGKILAMIPLYNEPGKIYGVVNIEKIDFMAFNKASLELMELIVHWTAKAISTIEYLDALKAGMLYDLQEGTYAYSHFDEMVRKEFERAKISGQKLTVTFIKLDRYGFLNADQQEVLKRAFLADLKRVTSPVDFIFNYRFGGTYALVSPLKGRPESEKTVERALRELEKIGGGFRAGCAEAEPKTEDYRQMIDRGLKTIGMSGGA